MLAVSDLPDILWNVSSGGVPESLTWLKVGLALVFFTAAVSWRRLRPLAQYAGVLLVLMASLRLSASIAATPSWQARFEPANVSFTRGFVGLYLRDTGVALVMIAALWALKARRDAFFLVKGRLDAPIDRVRWLGIGAGESWKVFGWIFTTVAAVAVLFPTMLAVRPSAETLARVVPLLPAILAFAAINAFNEEVYFRASVLSTLEAVLGRQQLLLLAAVFFGLAHFLYGSPPGVVGFLMTGFLAWLIAKSMLETRGMAWPWFMHFVPDVVVFASYAAARVQG